MALRLQFTGPSATKAVSSARSVRCAAVPLHVGYMPPANLMQHLIKAPTEEVAYQLVAAKPFLMLPGAPQIWEDDSDSKILDKQDKIRKTVTDTDIDTNKKIDKQKGPFGFFSSSSSSQE